MFTLNNESSIFNRDEYYSDAVPDAKAKPVSREGSMSFLWHLAVSIVSPSLVLLLE